MASKPDETALPRPFSRFEGFHGSAGTKYLLHLRFFPYRMNLPQVHIVGSQALQGKIQLRVGARTRAAVSLGGNENLLSEGREHCSVYFFRPAVPSNQPNYRNG